MAASLFIPGLAVALLPFTTQHVVLAATMAVVGTTLGVATPLSMTWLVQVVPAAARGTALALRLMVNRAGIVGIPLLAGILASASGAGAVFLLLGVVLASAGAAVAARWRTSEA